MMQPTEPFPNYHIAAMDILKFVHSRIGFDLWMITRVDDAEWVVLDTHDNGYKMHEGAVFKWKDSYCSRMVNGEGPTIAPCAADVPAYVAAPINKLATIGAYIGFPLRRRDGTLFGTLCGIDPRAWPESIRTELPLLELCTRFLATLLDQDAHGIELARRLERAEAAAMRDSLTMLANRRGWEMMAAAEFSRCRRHKLFAAVVSIDLDGLKVTNDGLGHEAGDDLLRNAAQVILESVRSSDIAARVGGDEFNVLLTECVAEDVPTQLARLSQSFEEAGVAASIGWAPFENSAQLADVCALADKMMYADKLFRKAGHAEAVR